MRRSSVYALVLWGALVALLALDWVSARPYNRFAEPPPWQLGQPAVEGAGHCAAPLR
jgi:hypothetical protein